MSKASKFTMVDPTQGEDVYQHMAQTVNDRMTKAVDELAEKHSNQGPSKDDASVDGPTGASYRQQEAVQQARQRKAAAKAKLAEEKAVEAAREEDIIKQLNEQHLLSDEEEDNFDNTGLDAEYKMLRERRLAELKAAAREKDENLSKGHGQYREIAQDGFLTEVTGSKKVLVHFYHNDFQRCKIMDKHLATLAPQHVEAKMLKIDAEKAPFFVAKLQVKILPTLIYFEDGVAVERLQGFQGLTEGMPVGKEDEFPLPRLGKMLAKMGAIKYTAPPTLDELRKFHLNAQMSAIRAGLSNAQYDDDEDVDGEISD